MVIVLGMYWIRATFPQRDLFTVIMATTLMNSYEGQLSTVKSLCNPSEECPQGFYGFMQPLGCMCASLKVFF